MVNLDYKIILLNLSDLVHKINLDKAETENKKAG